MAQLKCLSCGIQKEDSQNKAVCPLCGGEMIPVAEAEARVQTQAVLEAPVEAEGAFSPLVMRATMYEVALPALEDWTMLNVVKDPLQNFLKAQTANLPGEIFKMLWIPLERRINDIFSVREDGSYKEIATLAKATREFLSASDNASSGLGFSFITNSAASAAAYAGLSALDAKLSQGRAELAAAKKLEKVVASISTGNGCPSLASAIDRTVENLTEIYSEKERVQKYTEFYNNPAQNDVGVSLGGLNLFQVLAAIPNGIWGVLGTFENLYCLTGKEYDASVGAALLQIEGAGYIRMIRYGYGSYYVTTGKYEEMILLNKAMQNDDQLRAEEEKKKEEEYLRAETYLKNKKYYEAATAFARMDGYRDSMYRSIQIWDKHLRYSFARPSDVLLYPDGSLINKDNAHPIINKSYPFWKQVVRIEGVCLGLQYSGYVVPLRYVEGWKEPPEQECKNVSRICDGLSGYAFVYRDGRVRYYGEGMARHEGTVSQWRNISNVVVGAFGQSLIGLMADGTVCVSGELKAYPAYNNWRNVKKILEHLGTMFGLTSENTVYVAGKDADKYSELTKRNDVIDIVDSDAYGCHICGITTSGTVVTQDSVKNNPSFVNWCRGLRGVVDVREYIALKADGTIIWRDESKAPGKEIVDFSEWKDVLALAKSGREAVRADGTVLSPYSHNGSVLFSHINTINEERDRTINRRISELEKEIADLSLPPKGLKRLFGDKDSVMKRIRYKESEIEELTKALSSNSH